MALMDEFREEREAVKNGTLKQKAAYFWEYYKWYVIIPAIIIALLTSYIYHLITDPETLLNGIVLNTHNLESEIPVSNLTNGFYEAESIDTSEYEITLNTSLSYVAGDENATTNYEMSQALMTWIGAGTVDFVSGDLESMTELAYKEWFSNLTTTLTEEQIAKYEPYFLYIDMAVIERRHKALDDMEELSSIELPNCTQPETMEEPIPVLIDVSHCKELAEIYSNSADTLAIGISIKPSNLDMTLKFIDYLMAEEN